MDPSAHHYRAGRPPRPACCCPRRSGLRHRPLPLGGQGASLGLRMTLRPPAARAGSCAVEGLTSQVPARMWGLQPSPGLSHVLPNITCLQLCSVSPTTAWLLQTPREPSKSSTTRCRDHRPIAFSLLWLHQKIKGKKKRASEISAIHIGLEENCSQKQGTRKGLLGPRGDEGDRGPPEA